MSIGEKLSQIREAANHLIFPVFSELDAIALLYSVTIATVQFRWQIIDAIAAALHNNATRALFFIFLVEGVAIYSAVQVIKMSRENKRPTKDSRLNIAIVFYGAIAILTIISSLGSFQVIEARHSRFEVPLLIIQGLTFLRAITALFIIRTSPKISFLADRFNDTQATRHDLLLIALSLPFFYWWNSAYDVVTIVLVSYFYTVVTVSLLHDLERAAQ